MRHFLFEFITGGGLANQSVPESLVKEGDVMLQTLLRELTSLDDSKVTVTRDSRIDLLDKDVEQVVIKSDIEELLPELLNESDVAWLIAPETAHCLADYAELFIRHGKIAITSSVAAIKLATSKYLTNKTLAESGVNVICTRRLRESIPDSNTGWVVKPDDGVGCEKTFFIEDKKRLVDFINTDSAKNYVMQPFIKGKSMSMSLLVNDDQVQLIACNKQYVDIKNNVIKLTAIGVNECLAFKDEMSTLAKQIVASISGLAGYIGVDLIESNNTLHVVEVNPRLTTAYAGIPESIESNVALRILALFINNKFTDLDLDSAKPVRINV